MVETRRAVEAIEDILAVPEVGFVIVGTGDLSVSLGHPMTPDHPDVAAAETVLGAGREADVPVGCVAHGLDAAVEAVGAGYRIVRLGGDVASVRRVLGDRLAAVREAIE